MLTKRLQKITLCGIVFREFFFILYTVVGSRFHSNEMQTEATTLQVVKSKRHGAHVTLCRIFCITLVALRVRHKKFVWSLWRGLLITSIFRQDVNRNEPDNEVATRAICVL